MRILFPLLAFYPYQGGGPALSVYWLAKVLVKNNVIVDVVTSGKGVVDRHMLDVPIKVDGINVRYCKCKNPRYSFKIMRYSLVSVSSSDIVQLSSARFLPNLIIALYARYLGKKIIWSPRGEFSSSFKLQGSRKIHFAIIKTIFGKYASFHGTCLNEINEIYNIIGRNCKTIQIPNYMELPCKFESDVKHQFLYIGRISPVKSLDKLIMALSKSKFFMDSDYYLNIAGVAVREEEIDYERQLYKIVDELDMKNKVFFLGSVVDENKFKMYASSKFSFLVSESENFGNVVIEAMSQGTPVVTSLGTPWQILSENGVGYHVNNNPSSLSKVIDDIIIMPDSDYYELRARVQNFCKSNFSIDTNIGKWLNYYNSILA